MREAQGKSCQLDQLLCLLLTLGPQPWQFPPLHVGCPSGEGISRMLCSPESPEATLLAGPNTTFSQYSLHGQEGTTSAFPASFQMPQAVNIPMSTRGVGKQQYLLYWSLNNNIKDMEEKDPSGDRICKPFICSNPGKRQDCGCLMWSNPSMKNNGHKICC